MKQCSVNSFSFNWRDSLGRNPISLPFHYSARDGGWFGREDVGMDGGHSGGRRDGRVFRVKDVGRVASPLLIVLSHQFDQRASDSIKLELQK